MKSLDFRIDVQPVVFWLLILLFIIWPAPGTIALRYMILGLLLFATVYLSANKNKNSLELILQKSAFFTPILLLLILTIWILLSLVCFAVDKTTVKAEILGQWFPAVACFALGGSISYAGLLQKNRTSAKHSVAPYIWPVFLGSAFLVGFSVLIDFAYYLASGKTPYIVGSSALAPQVIYEKFVQGFSVQDSIVGESPDRFSMVVFIYISIVFAELFSRFKSVRVIPVNNFFLFLFAVVGLSAHYFVRNRNGNAVFLVEMAMVSVSFYYLHHDRISKAATVFVAAIFAVILSVSGMLFFKADHRWNDFLDTLPVALDTKNNTVWLTRDATTYPTLADGRVVDNSNYDRVAWAKEGVLLIFDNPIGTGFNRNAFGDGIDTKYERHGLSRGGHSHSGLIDFAIANGLPGLLLWVGFILSMVVLGAINLTKGNIWSGLFLIVYPSGFLVRSLLDSVIRDNYLQQFMFVLGLVWAWSFFRVKEGSCNGASP